MGRKLTESDIAKVFGTPPSTSDADAETRQILGKLNAEIRRDKRQNLSSDAILRSWQSKTPKAGARVRTVMHLIEKRLLAYIARAYPPPGVAEIFDASSLSPSIDCTPEGLLTLAAYGRTSPHASIDACSLRMKVRHQYMMHTYSVLLDMFSGWEMADCRTVHKHIRKWCRDAVNNEHHCPY